jgi:two-component system sensor histidine kinase AlgZ
MPVRHGVEPAADGGIIRVRTRVKLGRAVVSIANTVPPQRSQPGPASRCATCASGCA